MIENALVPVGQGGVAAIPSGEGPQTQLLSFIEEKVKSVLAEVAEMDEAIREALRNGFQVLALRRARAKLARALPFYEKVIAALRAGYVVMPPIRAEAFAVRIGKPFSLPCGHTERVGFGYDLGYSIPDIESSKPALGEGHYVAPEAELRYTATRTEKDKDGIEREVREVWPKAFVEEIPFPLVMCKPSIMNATQRAMALKVFDDVAISPSRGVRKKDPLIMGRIYRPGGKYKDPVCFLIAWLVRPEDVLA